MSHAALLVALTEPTDDIEAAVQYQMEPFDEQGKWFQEGSRWDWWQIGGRYHRILPSGPILRRRDIDLDRFAQHKIERLRMQYKEAASCTLSAEQAKFIFDVDLTLSEDEFIEQQLKERGTFPATYAFLKDRHWHERERMGWFGTPARTECELNGGETHICIHEDKQTGAKITSWGDNDSWNKMFYPRFVEQLPPDTLLVVVDYHV